MDAAGDVELSQVRGGRIATSAAGTPGELRVRFQPLQRTLLLEELRLTCDVLQETIARGETQTPGKSRPVRSRAAKKKDLKAVLRLLAAVEESPEDQPFEVVAGAPLLQGVAKGAATCIAELVQDALDEVQPGIDESQASDLRHFLTALQTWSETVLETHGRADGQTAPPPPEGG